MAKGKYQKATPKNSAKQRKLALILGLVMLLGVAVSGTLAYLATSTPPAENRFERTYITSRVNVTGDKIDVTNTGNIDGYIRAAIVVNWMNSNGDVSGKAPVTGTDYTLVINDTDWWQDPNTGFYYYKESVPSNGTTKPLISEVIVIGDVPHGYELSVQVVAEAIQAEGQNDGSEKAFQDAWGITVFGD